MVKGIIFNIKKFAVHDGPGIRSTIFFKGCPLECWWCHNPEGINPEPEIVDKIPYEPSIPSTKEIIGREVTVNEVMAEIKKDWIFYEQSNEGGITFSGGEPLMQADFLNHLLNACREEELMTTLDTSGYASWETIDKIKDKISLFLYDIKIIDDSKHQKYTGASNKIILSNLQKLDAEGANIIVRFPIVPGINDDEKNVNQTIKLLNNLKTTDEIHLLPFHNIAKGKYKKLKRKNRLENLQLPNDKVNEVASSFKEKGLVVNIGG
ncbi:MAG: glycyl-radical enzyme activating protein [Candidatus Hodarchaeales archaeon]|jgi:pyruvate formate lyase activating enzyme